MSSAYQSAVTPEPSQVSPNVSSPAAGLGFNDPQFVQRVDQAFADEGVSFGTRAKAVFTPHLVVVLWLYQILNHGSCREALLWLVSWSDRLDDAELDTGNYCRARAKIPEVVLRRIAVDTAADGERLSLPQWRWHARSVLLLDGTTISMPDTPQNQQIYPQSKTQKEGLGFPIMRLIVLLSLATGMLMDLEMGPYAGKESGETALFRAMLKRLDPGTVIVADRYFCSYFMIALAMGAGMDVVFRLHQRRQSDFRKGRRLGNNDRLIVWQRPDKPEWMSEEMYAEMPEQLTLRMVRAKVDQPGFRAEEVVVVTTLSDAEEYPADDIRELYHQRWQVELDIRSIKTTMNMEILKTKTPESCRREVWMHALAYNLARQQGIEVARGKGCAPRDISLSACLGVLKAYCAAGSTKLAGGPRSRPMQQVMNYHLGKQIVRNRPNRCEPRAVKRRPKQQKLLTEPRQLARQKLLSGKAAA